MRSLDRLQLSQQVATVSVTHLDFVIGGFLSLARVEEGRSLVFLPLSSFCSFFSNDYVSFLQTHSRGVVLQEPWV